MIRVKDLQFPSHFLQNESQLPPEIVYQLLEIEVKIDNMGEPDSVVFNNNKLTVSRPSSLTRFLFVVLYNLLKNQVYARIQQDKLGLGLLYACKDYTYVDYEFNSSKDAPPVLISFKKLHIPYLILKNIVEPVTKKIEFPSTLYAPSHFNDACEIIETQDKFAKRYKYTQTSISPHEYPILIVNSSLYNSAARMCHSMVKVMEYNFGRKTTRKVVKNLVLAENNDLEANLVSILKVLEGDPIFILDFLKFLESNTTLSIGEKQHAVNVREQIFANDRYLNEKTAQKHTPQVFKQWHQWSLIVGLIEKQLAPMRGSMWPVSETVKPYEDEKRLLESEEARKKGKTQLNFEELLELSRTWYDHKAVQPGELYEKLLRENRIWKT